MIVDFYRLDGVDEVTLDWHPAHGEADEYRGRMPDRLKDTPERHRARRTVHLLLALYAAACVGGFCVGFLAWTGTVGARLGHGMLGIFGAMVAIWLIVLALNVGRGVHGSLFRSKPSTGQTSVEATSIASTQGSSLP